MSQLPYAQLTGDSELGAETEWDAGALTALHKFVQRQFGGEWSLMRSEAILQLRGRAGFSLTLQPQLVDADERSCLNIDLCFNFSHGEMDDEVEYDIRVYRRKGTDAPQLRPNDYDGQTMLASGWAPDYQADRSGETTEPPLVGMMRWALEQHCQQLAT